MPWNPWRRHTPAEDHAELVRLYLAALAEHGLEAVEQDGALQASNGGTFGLDGIADTLTRTPRRRWATTVRQHVARLLAAQQAPRPERFEDVAELIHLRLMPSDYLPDPATARPWAGDVVVVPVLDHPETVEYLNDPELVERLGGWDRLRETGLANLRTLRADEVLAVDHGVHLSVGGFLNASRALTMEVLLAQDLGVELPEHGVLFVVPNRHLVALHVLTGPDVVAALQVLATMARQEADSPGPISDQVFFWRAGQVEQVTSTGPEGAVEIHVAGLLASAMADLGLLQEDPEAEA